MLCHDDDSIYLRPADDFTIFAYTLFDLCSNTSYLREEHYGAILDACRRYYDDYASPGKKAYCSTFSCAHTPGAASADEVFLLMAAARGYAA